MWLLGNMFFDSADQEAEWTDHYIYHNGGYECIVSIKSKLTIQFCIKWSHILDVDSCKKDEMIKKISF